MKTLLFLLISLSLLQSNEIATINNIKGDVNAKVASKSIKLENGMALETGMILISNNASSATIIFEDNSELLLSSNTIINLNKFVFKPVEKKYGFELFLEKGSMSFESGKIGELSPEDFILKTPNGTVAIRGTKFFVKVQ